MNFLVFLQLSLSSCTLGNFFSLIFSFLLLLADVDSFVLNSSVQHFLCLFCFNIVYLLYLVNADYLFLVPSKGADSILFLFMLSCSFLLFRLKDASNFGFSSICIFMYFSKKVEKLKAVICNCLCNLRKHNLGRQYDLQKRNIYSCTCWFFQYDDRYHSLVIIYKICKQMSSNYESIYFVVVVFLFTPI
jgi:hypothetical protein